MKAWKRRLCLALIALAPLSYLASRWAANHQAFIERVYSRQIYPFFAQPLSLLTGLLPVSLTEVLVFALLLLPIVLWLFYRKLAKRRVPVGRVLLGLMAGVSLAYALFTFGWALNYARLPYADTAGLAVRPASVEELKQLCVKLALEANALREGVQPDGEPYASPLTQRQVLGRIPAAYAQASQRYPHLGGCYGAPKLALLSYPLAKMQVAGIFSPFTWEAHVNSYETDALLPAVAAHEAAHLRGYAREDEANYIAYAVCTASGDDAFAYSGTLLALIYSGNALFDVDQEAYAKLYNLYSEGVRADLKAYNDNWARFEGKAAEVHEKVNDAYLKYNQQSDGVQSYGRMVDLLLAQMRAESGAAQ